MNLTVAKNISTVTYSGDQEKNIVFPTVQCFNLL